MEVYSDSVSEVPQGGCLGPLMYFIFNNNLPLVLKKAELTMYADDTTLHASATTPADLTAVLNKELARYYQKVDPLKTN